MAPPTTVIDNFNRADDTVPAAATADLSVDAFGWFTSGNVTVRPSVVSNQLVSLSAGWNQAARDPVRSLPIYAAVDLVGVGAAQFFDEIALVIGIQKMSTGAHDYDQDYTGYVFRYAPLEDPDLGNAHYIIGYGGNIGDGKTVANWVEGPMAQGAGRLALTVEVHPTDATKIRMTGWFNGVEVAHLDDTITNISIAIPTGGAEGLTGYSGGFSGIRIFSTEFVLDNWGDGVLTAGTAYTDTDTVTNKLTPSFANTFQAVDTVAVANKITPSEADVLVPSGDSIAIANKITPSQVDTLQAVDTAPVLVKITPSEVDTFQAADAVSILSKTTPSQVDTFQAADSILVPNKITPSEVDVLFAVDSVLISNVLTPSEVDIFAPVEVVSIYSPLTPSYLESAQFVDSITVGLLNKMTVGDFKFTDYVDAVNFSLLISGSIVEIAQFADQIFETVVISPSIVETLTHTDAFLVYSLLTIAITDIVLHGGSSLPLSSGYITKPTRGRLIITPAKGRVDAGIVG